MTKGKHLTLIFGHCAILSSWGIVLVTTAASICESINLDTAGPESIPCVNMQYTFFAPASINLKEKQKGHPV